MIPISKFIRYFAHLPNGKIILWCYLIWYLTTAVNHFDPSPSIWLNSLGISVVIGIALILSVGGISSMRVGKWQTFRLFAMPFCVSSFSSLIKGKGYILVFPPMASELVFAVGLCAVFVVGVVSLRHTHRTAKA